MFAVVSCNEVKMSGLKSSTADSLIYAAGSALNYDRVLELTDSLEQTGDISEMNANRWRGVAHYYKGEKHAAEHYYRKAVNGEIKSEQDMLGYNKSARRLAAMLVRQADYEGALQVALPAVEKLEKTSSGSPADFAILLSNIGFCQLNLGRVKEAAESYDRSFDYYQQAAETDQDGHGTYEALLGASRIAVAYLNAKYYAESQPWTDRCEELLERWYAKAKVGAIDSLYDHHRGHIALYRATALQGLGYAQEAAQAYQELLQTKYGKSDVGRIDANDYLLIAGRYREAADNYRRLNRVARKMDVEWSLEDIQSLLLPKFRANASAGHNPPVLGGGDEGGAFIDMLPNAPIGLWSGLKFEGEFIENIKGRPLFLYSDGLNEAENKEQHQFGDDHLLDVLRHLKNCKAKKVIECMYAEVEKHRNGAAPNDDLTMMCLKIDCDKVE